MWRRITLWVLLSLCVTSLSAQDNDEFQYDASALEGEPMRMIEVDTTLFRIPANIYLDPISQATRYYSLPVSERRRGLYYTTAEQIIAPTPNPLFVVQQPASHYSAAVWSAQSGYAMGASFEAATMTSDHWSVAGKLYALTGRDSFVEGGFRNTLSPSFTLNRIFGRDHLLEVSGSLYYSMRGLQMGSVSETFELLGTPYYNPSWGYYNGQVRNSRVRRQFAPNVEVAYRRPIAPQTQLVVRAKGSYEREANSSLGWYNASTPMPDYYMYLPSSTFAGDTQNALSDAWRINNTNYTQIYWDKLQLINSYSADGSAYYVVEDKVEKRSEGQLSALFISELGRRFTLTYGAEVGAERSRNFKQMRDLLGSDYLVDYDVFMGDNYNKTTPLQNDLQNPDRQVEVGDRFGYDYAITHSSTTALIRAVYRAPRLDFDIEAQIGEENYTRTGYYEKERFAGAASLGASSSVTSSPYLLRATIGYASGADKYFTLKLLSSALSPLERNLFLNAQLSNYLAPSSSGERISSAALAFRLNNSRYSLYAEIYALRSRGASSIYSLYDDLMSTMCRAIISGIGYSSYGVELTADYYLYKDLKLTTTLTAGRYTYDVDPTVELLDDYDLSTLSSPTSSRMSGIYIGNAPQVVATASASYFGLSRYIFSLSASYGGYRYEQASFARRSERLLSQAFVSDQSAVAALEQQRLDDIFDVELSASRYLWFDNGTRLSIRLSVRNLLSQSYRVAYARESDRISLQSYNGSYLGVTMREGTIQYTSPRTIRLSVNYKF